MRILMVAVALGISTLACPPAAVVCNQLETRCADDVVQLCDARGRWQDVMDCADMTPDEWHCGSDGGATCIRQP
jgi:RES domain-containing protein